MKNDTLSYDSLRYQRMICATIVGLPHLDPDSLFRPLPRWTMYIGTPNSGWTVLFDI